MRNKRLATVAVVLCVVAALSAARLHRHAHEIAKTTGIERLKQAAEAGKPDALGLYGAAMFDGNAAVPADAKLGEELMRRGASAGSAVAALELGRHLAKIGRGEEATSDPDKAASLFAESATAGDLGAAEAARKVASMPRPAPAPKPKAGDPQLFNPFPGATH
jgi:TPR repeat protein